MTHGRSAARTGGAADALHCPETDGVLVPILREPLAAPAPVVVSIPHFGTDPLPGIAAADYREPRFETFRHGYTDPFAAQIYGNLDLAGASVLATPISRLFVDVNRRRDDFQVEQRVVRSVRGVVRTHVRAGVPIFRAPLHPDAAERRLAAFYDPYHAALAHRLARLRRRFGHTVLLDAHTASADRIAGHEVVIGTRRGTTCSTALAQGVAAVVRRHGFAVCFDVPGYAGGHIVRSHGTPAGPVEAIQVEVNAVRIMGTPRRAWTEARRRGEMPSHDVVALSRLAACMRDVVRWIARHQPASRTG